MHRRDRPVVGHVLRRHAAGPRPPLDAGDTHRGVGATDDGPAQTRQRRPLDGLAPVDAREGGGVLDAKGDAGLSGRYDGGQLGAGMPPDPTDRLLETGGSQVSGDVEAATWSTQSTSRVDVSVTSRSARSASCGLRPVASATTPSTTASACGCVVHSNVSIPPFSPNADLALHVTRAALSPTAINADHTA